MKFYINKQIVERFKSENINADYIGTIIIILTSLYEKNYEFLDEIDDGNKCKRILLLYRYLVRKGYLQVPDEDSDKVHYELTEQGVTLTNFLLSFTEDDNEIHKEMLSEVIDSEQQTINETVENWISEWMSIFPSEKHFGRSLKTNIKDCTDRMKWFLSNFKFSKDEIMQSTKNYIESQRLSPDGHKYTRNSTYFILKGKGTSDRTSELATECEKLKDFKPSLIDSTYNRDSA